MCYMIVVGLPKVTQQYWLEKLPPPSHAWPASYAGLSQQMGNFAPFVIGTVMCSCALHNQSSDTSVAERYRKKGWSQSKIERALADRKKADRHAGLHSAWRHWLADAATAAGEAYLYIHWDSDELKYGEAVLVLPQNLREQTFKIKDEQMIHIKD